MTGATGSHIKGPLYFSMRLILLQMNESDVMPPNSYNVYIYIYRVFHDFRA